MRCSVKRWNETLGALYQYAEKPGISEGVVSSLSMELHRQWGAPVACFRDSYYPGGKASCLLYLPAVDQWAYPGSLSGAGAQPFTAARHGRQG